MHTSRPGADLAQLLLGSFRVMATKATAELTQRGFHDVRPVHEFALQAILSGEQNASDLGRRMAVTKQAAAKTIGALEEGGYVARTPDASDKRRMQIKVTERGNAMLAEGALIFDELREQLARQIGVERLAILEAGLREWMASNEIDMDPSNGATLELES